MDEMTRKKIEMGKRALEFCRANPDSNPVFAAAVARLEAHLARAAELEQQLENEQKPTGDPEETRPMGKVLQFEKRQTDDPTDPAA